MSAGAVPRPYPAGEPEEALQMRKITFATVVSSALAALAIGLAGPALADDAGGSVALAPGGPVAVYPITPNAGGANPYTPYGVDPYVPYGVWAPH
jgi:hypothetical protein